PPPSAFPDVRAVWPHPLGQVCQRALPGTLLRRAQGLDKRLQEGFQAGQDAPQQAGRDLGIVQQFLQAEAIESLPGSPYRQRGSPERIVCQGLGSVPAGDTVELISECGTEPRT